MSLSRHQLQHIDLDTEIEQNPRGWHHWNGRVSTSLFRENSRSLETMGELLRARVFGATEWAINLRRRLVDVPRVTSEERRDAQQVLRGLNSPEPHPDLDCEAPARRAWLDFAPEPLIGRLKMPARYRKDESDR